MVKKKFKYFNVQKDDKKIRHLCIFLPKYDAYRRDFHQAKYISFLVKDDGLLKKYNEIWEKVKNSLKKKFDSEPVNNEIYLKAKIKSYNEKLNKNFHDNKNSKKRSEFICLSVILMDYVFRTGKNYYCQMILKEYKYVVKEQKDA